MRLMLEADNAAAEAEFQERRTENNVEVIRLQVYMDEEEKFAEDDTTERSGLLISGKILKWQLQHRPDEL